MNLKPLLALLKKAVKYFVSKDYTEDRRKIIKFVQWLKRIAENPEADKWVRLTDFTHADDFLLKFLRQWLPYVLKRLQLANNSIVADGLLTEAISGLRSGKKVDWNEFASLLYSAKTENKVKIDQASLEIENEYLKMKEGGMLSSSFAP